MIQSVRNFGGTLFSIGVYEAALLILPGEAGPPTWPSAVFFLFVGTFIFVATAKTHGKPA